MQSQAVEGTTDINSLPNELSQGNVVMNVSEKNGKTVETPTIQFKKDRCSVCTLPLDQCSPNCAGRAPPVPTQLSKESINQIISGDKRINKQKAAKYAYHIFFEEMTRWNRLESNQNREDDELITKRLLQL